MNYKTFFIVNIVPCLFNEKENKKKDIKGKKRKGLRILGENKKKMFKRLIFVLHLLF
jgi:hypothetical protein